MGVISKSVIVTAIGLLGMASAQANVIYDWEPLTNTDDFSTTGGKLVLSDSAFESLRAEFSQSIDFDSDPGNP